jgi:hypothetical protein
LKKLESACIPEESERELKSGIVEKSSHKEAARYDSA